MLELLRAKENVQSLVDHYCLLLNEHDDFVRRCTVAISNVTYDRRTTANVITCSRAFCELDTKCLLVVSARFLETF